MEKFDQRKNDLTRTWATINEPDLSECVASAAWRLRILRCEQTEKAFIEIRLFKRDNRRSTLIISASDRADFDKIRRMLSSEDARLPILKKDAVAFVEKLMRSVPTEAIEYTSRPGFRNKGSGFVMPTYQLGSAKRNVVWRGGRDRVLIPPTGTLDDYRARVLEPALCAPHLTVALLIPLASALLDFYESRTGERLLPETAVFHFAADSSGGKTTLAKAAQAVSGSTFIDVDYRFSERGLEEAAARRSGLVLVVDDTETSELEERQLLKRMTTLGHRYSAGHSRAMSQSGASANFEALRWNGLAVSTGPETLSSLAQRLKSPRQGDRVRFIDVPIPQAKDGGILASTLPMAAAAVRPTHPSGFIADVEAGMAQNPAVLMQAWAKLLLKHGDPDEIKGLLNNFIEAVARGEDGLEKRFAMKLGVLEVAGLIAVRHRLVPWRDDWVRQAVRYVYKSARAARDPGETQVQAAIRKLRGALEDRDRFPRFVDRRGATPRLTSRAMGYRMMRDGKIHFILLAKRLGLLIPDAGIAKHTLQRLKAWGVIRQSTNLTGSIQIRVKEGSETKKHRFWKLSRRDLDRSIG